MGQAASELDKFLASFLRAGVIWTSSERGFLHVSSRKKECTCRFFTNPKLISRQLFTELAGTSCFESVHLGTDLFRVRISHGERENFLPVARPWDCGSHGS
jgi:hypothetical protein